MDSEIQQIKTCAEDLIDIANFPSMEKTVSDLLKKEAEIMQRCLNNYDNIHKRLRVDCEITSVQSPSPKGKEKLLKKPLLILHHKHQIPIFP